MEITITEDVKHISEKTMLDVVRELRSPGWGDDYSARIEMGRDVDGLKYAVVTVKMVECLDIQQGSDGIYIGARG